MITILEQRFLESLPRTLSNIVNILTKQQQTIEYLTEVVKSLKNEKKDI